LNLGVISGLIILAFFVSYLLGVGIFMYQRDVAYAKITAIPKKNLIEFYETRDIENIPKDKRRAWTGVLYRKIGVVPKNHSGVIKAVGWHFAYYDIENDAFWGAYH